MSERAALEFGWSQSGLSLQGAWDLYCEGVKGKGRKVIQISATTEGLVVLCDDGSLWASVEPDVWRRIKDVPQVNE